MKNVRGAEKSNRSIYTCIITLKGSDSQAVTQFKSNLAFRAASEVHMYKRESYVKSIWRRFSFGIRLPHSSSRDLHLFLHFRYQLLVTNLNSFQMDVTRISCSCIYQDWPTPSADQQSIETLMRRELTGDGRMLSTS